MQFLQYFPAIAVEYLQFLGIEHWSCIALPLQIFSMDYMEQKIFKKYIHSTRNICWEHTVE